MVPVRLPRPFVLRRLWGASGGHADITKPLQEKHSMSQKATIEMLYPNKTMAKIVQYNSAHFTTAKQSLGANYPKRTGCIGKDYIE